MIHKKINTAIIGFGFSGSIFHAPFLRINENYNLKCVVSSNPEKVQAELPGIRVESDYEQVIQDPSIDLIIITTPNDTHFPLAKAALEAGKHVVVDKPFTIHTKEAQELIQLAKLQKRILTVFHNRRWDGDFLTIKNLLSEKTLGEIYLYEAHFHRYRPTVRSERWKESSDLGSGILYDLGAHLIDQALCLFGLPESMDADVLQQREGAIADDYFHLTLKYGNKRVILKASSLVSNPGPRYQVHGTKGSFLKYGIDPQETDLLAGGNPMVLTWGQDKEANFGMLSVDNLHTKVPTIPGDYGMFYSVLAEAIKGKCPPPISAEEACNVIKIIEDCLKKTISRQPPLEQMR
jgi:scyllo-inositol 2-dehydrogenase (NADP+)